MTLKHAAVVQPPWHSGLVGKAKAAVRLFCFPYAGGAAGIFRTWESGFPSAVEVIPVELPGRGARWNEPPFSRLRPLVESIAEAIAGLLDRPFVLFGHSMGGLLSYELAQRLRQQRGPEPAHLIVSGCAAPHLIEYREKIFGVPDLEFVERMKAINGTPGEILENAELMQLLLPMLRADFAVIDTYLYQPSVRIACPITSLGGSEDPEVSVDDLLGWREHTTGRFDLHILSGDHFFINTRQDELLHLLARKLEGIVRLGT